MTARNRGMTLIELLVAVSLFVILLVLAGPGVLQFLGNSQLRNAGESMLNGVRTAQADAISKNAATRFLLIAGGWEIHQLVEGNDNVLQTYSLSQGASQATVTPNPPVANQVTFDGFGRVIANADASKQLLDMTITNNQVAGSRTLKVIVSSNASATGTKLCDPAAPATEPQACP